MPTRRGVHCFRNWFSAPVRIKVCCPCLYLRSAVRSHILQGHSSFFTKKGRAPENVGKPVLEFLALFRSQVEFAFCERPVEKGANFAGCFLQSQNRKIDSVAIIPQRNRHLGGKCLIFIKTFHGLSVAMDLLRPANYQPATGSGTMPAAAALDSSTSKCSRQKRDHDS